MTAKMRGSQIIDGIGERAKVYDTRGDTTQILAGAENRVKYKGDRGANKFFISGYNNQAEIYNVGRNDTVFVDGRAEDWVFMPNGDRGVIEGYNKQTGTTVLVATDDGRSDRFVEKHVVFQDGETVRQARERERYEHYDVASALRGHGGWGDLGYMGHNPGIYDHPYFSPRDHAIFEHGRMFGRYEAEMYGGGYGDHHCHCHYPMWGDPWSGGDPWFLLGGALGSILLG